MNSKITGYVDKLGKRRDDFTVKGYLACDCWSSVMLSGGVCTGVSRGYHIRVFQQSFCQCSMPKVIKEAKFLWDWRNS